MSFESLEPVAHAPDRQYLLRANLAPETVDMHFNGIAAHFLTPSVQLLLQFRTPEYARGLLDQHLQQRELAWHQRQRHTSLAGLVRGGIKGKFAMRIDGLLLSGTASQRGAHARGELVEIEGFHEVVIGARIQSANAVIHGIA